MSRFTLFRAAGVAAVLFGLTALAAGDPPAPTKDDAANKRLLYPVKHGSAKDLAAVLGEHFKGVAEFQAVPDASTNYLLISAAPAALDEVVKVLAQIDRPAQTASVEILIVSVAAKKADADKTAPAEDVDEKAFSGPIADVRAKVEALQKKGVVSDLKRLQLAVVEGQPASVLIGENKPYVTSINVTATGRASRSVSYRSVGTQADATVHVSPDKVVTVDLKLEDSRMATPEDGIPLGTDETGKPVLAAEFNITHLTSKLDLPSGQARAAEGVKTDAKSDKTHTFVIVGARVIEPDAKPDK